MGGPITHRGELTMARDYGQIRSAFWTHPEIRPASLLTKAIAAYLMTSLHTNGVGCFYCPPGYIADDLKVDYGDVQAAFESLEEINFLRFCQDTGYVLIPHFLKWNPIDNANVGKARLKEVSSVPMQFSYLVELAQAIERFGGEHLTVPQTLTQRVTQTLPETGANSEPNRTEPNGPEGNRSDPNPETLPHARARETTTDPDGSSSRSQPTEHVRGVPKEVLETAGIKLPRPPAPDPLEQAQLIAEASKRYPKPPTAETETP